jgi:hypothetical protein
MTAQEGKTENGAILEVKGWKIHVFESSIFITAYGKKVSPISICLNQYGEITAYNGINKLKIVKGKGQHEEIEVKNDIEGLLPNNNEEMK